jgi:shikimate dehydrogenase
MRAYGLGDPALPRAIGEAALLVNTTSLGMQGGPAPDESPVPAAWLHPKLLVFDIVYRPPVTPLLAAAADVGCATLGGLEMLVLQGAASLERWTGRRAPVGVMLRAARIALEAPVAARKDA